MKEFQKKIFVYFKTELSGVISEGIHEAICKEFIEDFLKESLNKLIKTSHKELLKKSAEKFHIPGRIVLETLKKILKIFKEILREIYGRILQF